MGMDSAETRRLKQLEGWDGYSKAGTAPAADRSRSGNGTFPVWVGRPSKPASRVEENIVKVPLGQNLAFP